jgi:hypothetical protein
MSLLSSSTILTLLESVRVVESSGWLERQSQMTNTLIKRHKQILNPLVWEKYTRQIVPSPCTISLDHFLWSYKCTSPVWKPSAGTNTQFLSHIFTLGLKPLARYSRQNGVSALRAFKTKQVHLVVLAAKPAIQLVCSTNVTSLKCGPRECTRGGYKRTFWCISPRQIGING